MDARYASGGIETPAAVSAKFVPAAPKIDHAGRRRVVSCAEPGPVSGRQSTKGDTWSPTALPFLRRQRAQRREQLVRRRPYPEVHIFTRIAHRARTVDDERR